MVMAPWSCARGSGKGFFSPRFPRTATTGMAKLGIDWHIADRILNHKQGVIRGVAAIYNRHAYLEERRAALVRWADYVLQLAHATDVNAMPPRTSVAG
jgi:hypothetical protein